MVIENQGLDALTSQDRVYNCFFWFSAQRDVQLLAHFVPAAVSLLALIRPMLAWIVVAVRCPQFAKFPTVFFRFCQTAFAACLFWLNTVTNHAKHRTYESYNNSFFWRSKTRVRFEPFPFLPCRPSRHALVPFLGQSLVQLECIGLLTMAGFCRFSKEGKRSSSIQA